MHLEKSANEAAPLFAAEPTLSAKMSNGFDVISEAC